MEEQIPTIQEEGEENIVTINEGLILAGVTSVNGLTGDVPLKTVNGQEVTGEGNIEIDVGQGTVKSVNQINPDEEGNVTLTASDVGAATQADIQTAVAGKQDKLTQTQLNAVNSGIDSTKVGQIATNAQDITTIEGKIPSAASTSNQLADKNFVNSSVATNTANYISDNGEPFDSLADLEAYSGPLTNNDYAFVVGTDQAGNTTYTRYKYNATTQTWAEEYVLNNSSFTADQWASINSGITSANVTKLTGLADIKAIGANLNLDSETGELSATDTTYSNFTGTDGVSAGTAGLVPAPATSDAGKFLKADGTWATAGGGGGGTTETVTIASASWASLASSSPFTYSATVTLVTTIGNDTTVELINDQAVAFANYGFAIGAIAGQNVTIYSVGQPSASITLTFNVEG